MDEAVRGRDDANRNLRGSGVGSNKIGGITLELMRSDRKTRPLIYT